VVFLMAISLISIRATAYVRFEKERNWE